MKISFILMSVVLATTTVNAEERFPEVTLEEIVAAETELEAEGQKEVFSLSYLRISEFILNRYWRGEYDPFHYFGTNPNELTTSQVQKPAILLLHAMSCNQGEWIPLLRKIAKYNKSVASDLQSGPIFTLNYPENDSATHITRKIEAIRALYLQAGIENVEITLIGHSLGAIVGAEYAYNPESWVEKTTVKKLISLAGRLKNIEPPTTTPFYPAVSDVLPRIDMIWHNIQENRGKVELITLSAESDWLLPIETTHVGDTKIIIPDVGHVLIAESERTFQELIKFLNN